MKVLLVNPRVFEDMTVSDDLMGGEFSNWESDRQGQNGGRYCFGYGG